MRGRRDPRRAIYVRFVLRWRRRVSFDRRCCFSSAFVCSVSELILVIYLPYAFWFSEAALNVGAIAARVNLIH